MVLTDLESGLRRSLLSNARGEYHFYLLHPSRYQLDCRLDGFENLSGIVGSIQVLIATPRELKAPPFAMQKQRRAANELSNPWTIASNLYPANTWPIKVGVRSRRPTSLWPYQSGLLPDGSKLSGSFSNDLAVYFPNHPLQGPASDSSPSPVPQSGQSPRSVPSASPSPAFGISLAESQVTKLVNTQSATHSGTFTDLQLWYLPLAGIRTFDSLALLLPGVSPPPETVSTTTGPGVGASVGTAGQFSVNGLRSRGNNFTIDGSDNNDEDIGVRRQGFTALVPQPIESVKQFQIATLLPEPQFGRSLGAQANVVSRSGTNAFRGLAYGLFTDRRLNARNFFDLAGESTARFAVPRSATDLSPVLLDAQQLFQANPSGGENPFTRSQAGIVAGGMFRQEKSYVFGAFEHQDIQASRESHFAVPTVAERGLFSRGAEGLETRNRIGDLETRRLFFPTTAYGDALFSMFPWPNNPLGPYGANTRTEILPADADGLVLSFKADQRWQIGNSLQVLAGRFNFSDDETLLPATGQALFSTLLSQVRTQNLSLFLDSLISSRTSNQVRFSFGRTRMRTRSHAQALTGGRETVFSDPADDEFLLSAPLTYNFSIPIRANQPTSFASYGYLQQLGAQGLPSVNGSEAVTGPLGSVIVSGFSPLGIDVFHFPQQRTNNTFQIADTLIRQQSENYRIVTGFDLRRSQLNSLFHRNSRSQIVFSGAPNLNLTDGKPNELFRDGEVAENFTGTPSFFRGADFAALAAATGFFQTLRGPEGFGTLGLRQWQNDLFVATQVRLQSHLNLTLGLRYSLNTVPVEVKGRIESSFQSDAVRGLIAAEKQASQLAGRGSVSGFERFLNGREKIFRGDHNNVGPYLAFAWDPFGRGRTAVRGGFGSYYDQIPGAVISQSRNVFPNFLTLNLGGYRSNPTDPPERFLLAPFNPQHFARNGTLSNYDEGGPGGKDLVAFMVQTAARTNNGSGPAFVLPAADLQTPQAYHWSLNVEQELPGHSLVSIAYVGTRGQRLLRFATPNLGRNVVPTVLEVIAYASANEPAFLGTTVPPGQQVVNAGTRLTTTGRPFPLLGSFTSIESDANSSYHSLQLRWNRSYARGLQWTSSYTWSHAIDEISDLFDLAGSSALPQNSQNLRDERSSAGFDVRHRLTASAIWDLPWRKANPVLGRWRLASIVTTQTGQPFSILAPFDMNLDGNLTDRLNGRGGFQEIRSGPDQFRFDNPLNRLAPIGQPGSEGRNTFRSPGLATIDLAVSKQFRMTERHILECRGEFFNLFNRTHFGMPVNQVDFPGFGRSTSTRVPARVIQVALRVSF